LLPWHATKFSVNFYTSTINDNTKSKQLLESGRKSNFLYIYQPVTVLHYVEFRTKNYYQTRTNIQYEENIIPNHNMTKFWGIIMDETLTWNEHIDSAAKKLCTASYVIRNLKHILSPTLLKTLYYAYIHPIIS
jgi:uncharacterized sodium:solute symporter family permease YidK